MTGALLVVMALAAPAPQASQPVFALRAAVALAAPAPQASQPVFALRVAVALASQHALGVVAERHRLAASQADRDATAGKALPQLSWRNNMNYTQLPSGQANPGGLGGLVGFPAQGGTLDTTISGNLTLFDAFANRDNTAVAEAQVNVARLTLDQARQDAMRDAAVAYFDVLGAEAQALVAAGALSQSQGHLKIGEARLAAGTATKAEVLRLRAELATSRRQLVQARHAVTRGRMTLENTVDASLGGQALEPEPAVRPLDLRPERDLPASFARRPDVQQAELRARQDALRADIEGRAGWPTLSGSSSYTQRGFGAGQFQAGAGLNWPLFDGQQTRRRAESAQEQAEASDVQARKTRQAALLDMRQQLDAREEAREVVASAREGLASAEEAYRLARLRYGEGIATTNEVLDAQATLAESRRAYLGGVRDMRVAEIRLARSLGLDLAALLGVDPR